MIKIKKKYIISFCIATVFSIGAGIINVNLLNIEKVQIFIPDKITENKVVESPIKENIEIDSPQNNSRYFENSDPLYNLSDIKADSIPDNVIEEF